MTNLDDENRVKMGEGIAHTFWLYYFDNRPVLRKDTDFTLCETSTTEIKIRRKPDVISISLADILNIELFKLVGGHRYNAAVKLTYGPELNELYLWAVDPFTCQPSAVESMRLKQVLTEFQANQSSTVEPNPYLRELKRKGREDEFLQDKYDSQINPMAFQTKPTIKSVAINVAILVMIIFAITVTFGLIGTWFS